MSIGAILPGGYVITDRKPATRMSDCIEIANSNLNAESGYRKVESFKDDGTWISTVNYQNSEAIQTCIAKSDGNVFFTEAKK